MNATITEPHTAGACGKRGPGRPRLPTPERRRNILASKAKWRLENREYYLEQKRELSGRPEYLTRRRELRAQRRQRPNWVDCTEGESPLQGNGYRPPSCILDYALYDESTDPGDAF